MDQEIDIETIGAPRGGVGAGRARGGRPSQQDDLVCLHDPRSSTWLLVLADGMGGDGAGELGSAGVIAAAKRAWARGDWRGLPGAVFLEQVCQDAHVELLRRGEKLADASPHATVVALLLKGRHAFWAHVGDSRLYRIERGCVVGRTEDHSLVQERVRRGELDPAEAGVAPDQHQLLRGLGGTRRPEVEHGYAPRRRGQYFALCSDGVWTQLSGAELVVFAGRPEPSDAVREALSLVLHRGGDRGDNAALILVRAAPAGLNLPAWLRHAWSKIRGALAVGGRAGATFPVDRFRCMPLTRVSPSARHPFRGARCLTWLPMLLALGGCAQLQGLLHPPPKVAVPPPAPAPAPVAAPAPPPVELHPLAWIVNRQLQHGHYEDGARYLRRYLEAHPDDRVAEDLLHQLTDDPRQRLGPPAQVHEVQAGESFSTLAKRYLGDGRQFLILARYNGSDDPSRLWVGQKVKLPRARRGAVRPLAPAPAQAPSESVAGRSQALQRESLSLLRAGQETQALAKLDAALKQDPGLASDRETAGALRQQLVSACHERAIVLYRDQKLVPAIALWDRVLEIEPGYEPAIAYRARALELQRRLKQL